MRTTNRRRALVGILAAVFLGGGLARAGHRDDRGVIAIRQVRIVPVSGPAIESGTIVIAGGVVVAVGASVDPPPGAEIMEGMGLMVYPGLFDALSTLGLPEAAQSAGPRGAQAGAPAPPTGGPPARGPESRPASTPWVVAADDFRTTDARIDAWRRAGFTSALVAPGAGIFPGQGSVVNLGRDADRAIVKARASLQIALRPSGRSGAYPNSLMGVLAYIKQVYADAEDARRPMDASQPRPGYDRTVDAINAAVASRLPTLIPGSTRVQIRRALDLSRAIAVPPVIVGAHEGYDVAEGLAKAGASVVLGVKWPEPVPDGDDEVTLRALQVSERAPTTPEALRKAGVPFSFTSDGLTTPTAMLRAVRRAVDAGLPRDAAVRALTLAPAQLYGVADRLGSIEVGKVANLVLTEGDLLDDDMKVRVVFVDGVPFPREDARGESRAAVNRRVADGSLGAASLGMRRTR